MKEDDFAWCLRW